MAFFVPIFAIAQTAGFTASPLSGCAPLVVHFTNTSSGASSYFWNLGNGTTSGLTDPSGSYLTPGVYTASLTATGSSGSSSATVTITVFPAPTVSFYAPDTAVCPGTPVSFISTTTPGVPGALNYVWNFGDGSTSSAVSPSHTFPGPGYYNITLFATNSEGCQSDSIMASYIHVYNPPVASMSVSSSYFCTVPATADFTSSVSGFGPFTYSWNFGDGGTSTSTNPNHTYTSTGDYTVMLTVTDGHGCTDQITYTDYVDVATLSASFTCPASACPDSWVNFTSTGAASSAYSWSFGDGGSGGGSSTAHEYTTSGVFTVTLTTGTGTCTATAVRTISIDPVPPVGISYTPTNSCPAPATISFTATGAPAGSTAAWDYDDGHTGTGITASNTFAANGCYTVVSTVTTSGGCVFVDSTVIEIYPLIVTVTDTPFAGCVPLTVPFSASVNSVNCSGATIPYPFGVTSYTWHFGDGTPNSTSPAPTHTYVDTGVFSGSLTITTGNGCTKITPFIIQVGVVPTVTCVATTTNVCVHGTVNFTATVTGPWTSVDWTFGDGNASNDSALGTNHTYTYPDTGYTVTVRAYDHGCPSNLYTYPFRIRVDSPWASFVDTFTCIPPTSVGFFDSSIGATSWTWLFPGGYTSTLLNPVFNFDSLGIWIVKLATYNFRSGCRDTFTASVNLFRPVPVIAYDSAICIMQRDTLYGSVSGGSGVSYAWYIAWPSNPDSFVYIYDTLNNKLVDTFLTKGIYHARLIIQDQHGCFDTTTRSLIVAKPADSFSAAPPNGCWPLTVTFTDHSTDVGGIGMSYYSWTYGDGTTGTGDPATHMYTAAGSFGVTEIVTDAIGCKDTLFKPSLIAVSRPHALFTVSNTAPCVGDSIIFTNLSSSIVSQMWMFGDGGTASTNPVNWAYNDTGSYTVKLAVVDSNGCTDTAVYNHYVNVNQPFASFFNTDSISLCPPLSCHFVNTSWGATSYQWVFGNGDNSTIMSPNELYTGSGYDTVLLVATNPFGCKDTAVGHVNLLGYNGAFSYTPDSGCAPLKVFFNAGLINVPSIIWDFADGSVSSSSSLDTITHYYVLPGKYLPKLILSDLTGCENSSLGLDTIRVDTVYAGFTTIPNPVCLDQTVNYQDTSHSYFSHITAWIWKLCSTCSDSVSSPAMVYTATGVYPVTLIATDAWGCSSQMSGSVNVLPPPTIKASGDTTVCVGDPATLTATGGVSYIWSPGTTLSCTHCNPTSASPTVVTQYTVTGTDAAGCAATDTVNVYIRTKTFSNAFGGGEACMGVPQQLSDTGATKFTWLPASGLNQYNIGNPIAIPEVTTTYTVIAQYAGCIPDTNYITVKVNPLPQVQTGPDQTIVDGASANLTSTGSNIHVLSWSPFGTLSCDSCPDPVATPPATTTYFIDVTSLFGCKASDSVTIKVVCDASQVFIPNSFTPNGDGVNDVFYPRGSGINTVKSFRIYNRWGELLFEKENFEINDVNSAWNGSYMGGTPRPDVYVYIVEATCNNGQPLFIKGDVTIIR